jgi:hypothetical protein
MVGSNVMRYLGPRVGNSAENDNPVLRSSSRCSLLPDARRRSGRSHIRAQNHESDECPLTSVMTATYLPKEADYGKA